MIPVDNVDAVVAVPFAIVFAWWAVRLRWSRISAWLGLDE